ncbi:MAG: Mini-ribonuclease 3 [Clostridia bacterium]|nr:Mini-ribonuclease 3 [Clostridia bacterium]
MTEAEAKQINPVVLAFLGDAVYTLWVREKLVKSGAGKASEFQRAAAKIVSARGQSAFLERVLPLLTEEEEEVFRRGRNAKKPTKSKHATPAEYNRSTGFEAVIGFLHLTERSARIEELLSLTDGEMLKGQAAEKVYKP